jgi:CubicO group peptidase (beta-lactamase class C family)
MAVSPSVLGGLVEVFERNFRDHGELGASVSVWWGGVEVLGLSHGWCERERAREWTRDTLVPVYSATKVPAASALLLALQERGLDQHTAVREVWPRFPVAGASFADLLSHRCGLPILDRRAGILDHDEVLAAMEEQQPAWALGEGHGYHPRTFGVLVEEPVRRLTGRTLGTYWRERIAEPCGIDFWIGLPEEHWPRVARLYPGKVSQDDLADSFYKHLTSSGSFTRRAFSSPAGMHAVQDMNEPGAWAAGFPAIGGVGTAAALAKFYQILLGGLAGPFSDAVRCALATPVSRADDKVLLRPTVFSCGAQLDPVDGHGVKLRRIFGPSDSGFGHPGAGGSHAMADPLSGISFAYVMNQMNLGVMPGIKCTTMLDSLFADLAG